MMFTQSRSPRCALGPALVVASLVLSSPALASPTAGSGHSTSPRSLVLHVKDMPASFGKGLRELGKTVEDNEEVNRVHVTVAELKKHGRVAGYLTLLGNSDKRHAISIQDEVVLYRSAGGAHWQYQKETKLSSYMPNAKRLNVSGIGDEATGSIAGNASSPFPLFLGEVDFRRGKYDGHIYVTHLGTLHEAELLQLARTLDGRIRRAR